MDVRKDGTIFFSLWEKERGKWTIPQYSRSSKCYGIILQYNTMHAEHQGCFFFNTRTTYNKKCWSLLACLCSVTSSEKVDKAQRYADFTLLSVPYPGKTPSSDLLLHSTSWRLERFLYTMVRISEGTKPGVWQYLQCTWYMVAVVHQTTRKAVCFWVSLPFQWDSSLPCPSSSSPTCMHVF